MRTKRICCKGLIILILVASLCINTWAIPPETFDLIETRATGTFTIRIDPHSTTRANSSFPLATGETMRIDVIFTPEDVDLDFGLVAPNGKFYFLSTTGGDINETIRVEDNGNYYLQFRNNSNVEVILTGFVYY